MDMFHIEKALPVWGGDISADSYRIFRHDFNWNGTGEVSLEISADSTFEIAVNGHTLPIQQLADYPDERTFSTADITALLRPGGNRIAVLVHHIGDDFLTYQRGIPYLQAVIYTGKKLLSATGPDWQFSSETPYRSGSCCKLTVQLGFVFEYDAAVSPAEWKTVRIVHPAGSLKPRKVPQLEELPRRNSTIRQCGVLKREAELGSFAETCSEDYLKTLPVKRIFARPDLSGLRYTEKKFQLDGQPFTFRELSSFHGADGFYVICDLGKETVGYLTFRLEAPEGTIVDIVHGEHLDDGRVRGKIGSRNFADRFHCRAGMNGFTCRHRRLGARFLELHITNCGGGPITLYDLGLIELELPLPEAASFHCEDRALLHLNQLSAATLKCCMHEHYEDCPWREQGLYAYDSRNQILFGYYVWGNYAFAEASLDLLGKSCGERYLTLTAPGRHELTIPVFSLVWICELYEYQLFSGSDGLFRRWQPAADRILDRALAEPVPGHEEFYHSGSGKEIWNFCEWQGELSHVDRHPQSVFNIYLYEALKAAAALHTLNGNRERAGYLSGRADRLGAALEKTFWRKNGYTVFPDEPSDSRLYEHIQALFLYSGLVPAEKTVPLLAGLREKSTFPITFSALPYLIRGLIDCGAEGRRLLLARLQEIYGPSVFSDATTLSETPNGADDFDNAGSLCHGWSAVFPLWCGMILLGVRPLKPGFAEFEVRPWCGDLTHAEGEIPTLHGMIHISWQQNCRHELSLDVIHPRGLKCRIADWDEFPLSGQVSVHESEA